jgi:hypothetical protein
MARWIAAVAEWTFRDESLNHRLVGRSGPIGNMHQTSSPPPRGELDQLRQELLRRILNNEARRKGRPEASGK